jgi:two-component system, NtrC family, response regulator
LNKILIIDDEEKLRGLLARIIQLEGFEVIEADNYKSGLKKAIANDIDVIVCDVKLPDGSGLALSKYLKEQNILAEIILLTAYGNIPDSVTAIKNGAFDYITKGDDNNRIIPLLYKAIEKVQLAKRIQQLEKRLDSKYSFDAILGESKSIKLAIDAAKRVSATEATVLLNGETGTGKEVFAQAIHHNSLRAKQNFLAVNCAAFSKELLESELFGHKAGAFTGATKETKGIFEEANNGTVFLDEIGEMSIELQAKLLRVLETGAFFKVGDSKTTKVNVRIIAATNRNLQDEIESGTFREDLYYRLAVFQISLPPLRERLSDINTLAHTFLYHFLARTNKKKKELSKQFIEVLQKHTWKGNIRELKNIIERSVILSDEPVIDIDTLPINFTGLLSDTASSKSLSAFDLASAEKLHIQKVLNYTNGNKTESAKLLNIALTTLYRKIDEYKLS